MPFLEKAKEDVVDDLEVILGVSLGKQAVVDEETLDRLRVNQMVPLGDLLRRHALLLGLDGDRRAMLVRPGHHEDVIPFKAMVLGEYVRRQQRASYMPKMDRAVGIWPRCTYNDLCHWNLMRILLKGFKS
jgi:hypothetical protein